MWAMMARWGSGEGGGEVLTVLRILEYILLRHFFSS